MLKLKDYKGCGACEKCSSNFDCKAHTIPVSIKFNKPQKWDNWGHMVTVFKSGQIVQGYAVVENGNVYCASAESTVYEGVVDFISLKNVEIETVN